jgi:ABC-type glycerol-3-phosphate transport system substrate-binding protein
MNADLFGDKMLLNEPEAMEALQYLYDLVWGPEPVAPNEAQTGEFGWWNIFSTGKTAFMESHSWTVTNYIRENDFRWDFTDLPVAPGGGKAGLTFTNGYSIGHSTKYPEQSVRLLDFLVGPWTQKATAVGIIGSQPARRSMTDIWDEQSMGARAGYDVAAFTRTMDDARLQPVFKDGAAVNEITNPIWDQIWLTGEMGLEEGVDLMVQRVDEFYAG